MRLLYISEGDIPSRFAHATQAMNMAAALSAQVSQLTLLTAGSVAPRNGSAGTIFDWYGFQPTFDVVRLPVAWRVPDLCQSGPQSPTGKRKLGRRSWKNRFVMAASLYARWSRPDLVYTRCCRAGRYAASLGLPTIVEYHDAGEHAARQLKDAPRRDNLLGVVTVSEYLARQFAARGIPAEKIQVEPNGVDLSDFEKAGEPSAVRCRLRLPATRPVVMYCGHLYEKKGVHQLIEAARHLPEVLFCLVGGWPDDVARLRTLAADLNNVEFRGFVPHKSVPCYLAAADVLVLPNSARFAHAQETCPLKLFEYAAAGKPIVATRVAGIASLVQHKAEAWLVEPDCGASLAAGIRRMLADRALAARLGHAARRWVQRYRWGPRAERILRQCGVVPGAAGTRHAPVRRVA